MTEQIQRYFFVEKVDEHIQHSEQGWILYADHLAAMAKNNEEAKKLRADASWAATHRSELADLRNAFKKAEERVRKLRGALNLMVSPIEHLGGCLWKSDKRMPCQCGYNDRINVALRKAHAALEATND